MTRINCIPVESLTDQHLLIEYREITRISSLARPLDSYGSYTMGKGHVRFFYDKGRYLARRCAQLYRECCRRQFQVVKKTYRSHPRGLNKDWQPRPEDVNINVQRLQAKVEERPEFYRFWRQTAATSHYRNLPPKRSKLLIPEGKA